MKTERRHELQTNELAVWLTKWIDKLKPYSKIITGTFLLAAVVVFAITFINSRKSQNQAEAWTAYFDALESGNHDEFQQVSKTYSNTNAASWSLLTAGDTHLGRGAAAMFRDRDDAKEELESARDAYSDVVEQTSDPMIKQRGLFGLAQAVESLGELGEAKKHYQQIIDTWPNSFIAQSAQSRLDLLSKPETLDWYAWFGEQEPAANPLEDPSLFQDLPNLPDNPNLSLPEPGDLIKPDGIDPIKLPLIGDDSGEQTSEYDDPSDIALPGDELETGNQRAVDPLDTLDADDSDSDQSSSTADGQDNP